VRDTVPQSYPPLSACRGAHDYAETGAWETVVLQGKSYELPYVRCRVCGFERVGWPAWWHAMGYGA
jgi:hypothetical protein